MKVDRARVERSLQRKGFRRDSTGHHIYFFHEYEGKKTGIKTFLSHSKKLKDISGDLLVKMKRHLRLDSTPDAVDLLECPMDGDAYNEKMIQKGVFLR